MHSKIIRFMQEKNSGVLHNLLINIITSRLTLKMYFFFKLMQWIETIFPKLQKTKLKSVMQSYMEVSKPK